MKAKKKSDTPSGETPRKGTAFWFCLIFFVSAWMFVLGVLVGRGTAPVHFDIEALQKELAALKEAVTQKELQRYKIHSSGAAAAPELQFHEALQQPREDGSQSSETDDPLLRAAPPRRMTAPERPSVSRSTAKPPQTAESPAAPPLPGRTAAGNFTVQVAALKEAGLADRMVADLYKKGFPAYRVAADVPGKGTWYRVRIGSFKNRTAAERMLAQLKREKVSGIIVEKN